MAENASPTSCAASIPPFVQSPQTPEKLFKDHVCYLTFWLGRYGSDYCVFPRMESNCIFVFSSLQYHSR